MMNVSLGSFIKHQFMCQRDRLVNSEHFDIDLVLKHTLYFLNRWRFSVTCIQIETKEFYPIIDHYKDPIKCQQSFLRVTPNPIYWIKWAPSLDSQQNRAKQISLTDFDCIEITISVNRDDKLWSERFWNINISKFYSNKSTF